MWTVEIDGKQYKFDLLTTTVSGMKRFLMNDYLVIEKQMHFGKFSHSMPIDHHVVTVAEGDKGYELYVDNQPFSHMYNQNFTMGVMSSHAAYEDSSSYNPSKKSKATLEYNPGTGQYELKAASGSRPKVDRSELPMGYRVNNPNEGMGYSAPVEAKEGTSWDTGKGFEFEEKSAKPQIPGIFANQIANKEKQKQKPIQRAPQASKIRPEAQAPLPNPTSQTSPQETFQSPQYQQPIPQAPATIQAQPGPEIDFLDMPPKTSNPESLLPDDLFDDPIPSFPTSSIPQYDPNPLPNFTASSSGIRKESYKT